MTAKKKESKKYRRHVGIRGQTGSSHCRLDTSRLRAGSLQRYFCMTFLKSFSSTTAPEPEHLAFFCRSLQRPV